MAVIDETWEFMSDDSGTLLLARAPHVPARIIWSCDIRSRDDPPSIEDGKLMASVPELLRDNAKLKRELAEARDV